MNEVITSATFWTALAAVSTAVSVIVALFLPFYLKSREEERARLLVARELAHNMPQLRAISSMSGDPVLLATPGATGISIDPVQHFNAVRKHLSIVHWEHFRFQLATKHYECFAPLFSVLEHIISVEGDPRMVMLLGGEEAKTLVQDYETTAKRCRYLRT